MKSWTLSFWRHPLQELVERIKSYLLRRWVLIFILKFVHFLEQTRRSIALPKGSWSDLPGRSTWPCPGQWCLVLIFHVRRLWQLICGQTFNQKSCQRDSKKHYTKINGITDESIQISHLLGAEVGQENPLDWRSTIARLYSADCNESTK